MSQAFDKSAPKTTFKLKEIEVAIGSLFIKKCVLKNFEKFTGKQSLRK